MNRMANLVLFVVSLNDNLVAKYSESDRSASGKTSNTIVNFTCVSEIIFI